VLVFAAGRATHIAHLEPFQPLLKPNAAIGEIDRVPRLHISAHRRRPFQAIVDGVSS
jgi:hypothetical protein